MAARTGFASRPWASNRSRSKFDDTWMSIEGEAVGTTARTSYVPVASVRTRMSLTLVAMVSRSTGNPICAAT